MHLLLGIILTPKNSIQRYKSNISVKAIRKEPNDYDLFLRRSVTNQKLKRMSKAMEDAKTLIKLDSANAIVKAIH